MDWIHYTRHSVAWWVVLTALAALLMLAVMASPLHGIA